MDPGLRIRRFAPEEWCTYRDLRLRALAESPDAFGSTFAHERARPDAEWAARLDAGARSPAEAPLLAERDGEPVGLAWARLEEGAAGVARLYQVWVAPEHRGTAQREASSTRPPRGRARRARTRSRST